MHNLNVVVNRVMNKTYRILSKVLKYFSGRIIFNEGCPLIAYYVLLGVNNRN